MNGTTAFALGGLAGNNAHGAGFLHAAWERKIQPSIISCTSGQILWTYRYLKIQFGGEKKNLKQYLEDEIASVQPTRNVNLDLATICLLGKPGVFRPAWLEYFGDMFENAFNSLQNIMTRPMETNLALEFWQLFPSRLLTSDRSAEFFKEISDTFENAPIGIVFNSYNPRSGDENVFPNREAWKMLNKTEGQRDRYRDRITYCRVSPQAIRDALHLYQYGFEPKDSQFVDGAYFRDIMLSELTSANTIYSVRPISHEWRGRMPHNWPDMEDFKTEIGFDGSYCGERYQIRLINKLVDDKVFKNGKYHHIELEELEIKQPRGFFDYVFESMRVFENAYQQALEKLTSKPKTRTAH